MTTISFDAAMPLFTLRIKELEGEVSLLYRTVKRGGSHANKEQLATLNHKRAQLEMAQSMKRDFIKAFKRPSKTR